MTHWQYLIQQTMSSTVLLGQNKILAYFTLDSSVNTQQLPLLEPSAYTTMIFHNHYPIIYLEKIYEHFKNCLPQEANSGNLRIYLGKEELPLELPFGLFIETSPICLTVRIDLQRTMPPPFKVIKNTWKKAFEVINQNRRCDYVKARLNDQQLFIKFKAYCSGESHNLQNQGLYEGTNMIVKGFVEGIIIQRKYRVAVLKTMQQIVQALFGFEDQELKDRKFIIKSHNIEIDLTMSSKKFLDEWSYNDGYCYLKVTKAKEEDGNREKVDQE